MKPSDGEKVSIEVDIWSREKEREVLKRVNNRRLLNCSQLKNWKRVVEGGYGDQFKIRKCSSDILLVYQLMGTEKRKMKRKRKREKRKRKMKMKKRRERRRRVERDGSRERWGGR